MVLVKIAHKGRRARGLLSRIKRERPRTSEREELAHAPRFLFSARICVQPRWKVSRAKANAVIHKFCIPWIFPLTSSVRTEMETERERSCLDSTMKRPVCRFKNYRVTSIVGNRKRIAEYFLSGSAASYIIMRSLRNEQQFDPRQKHESHPRGGWAPVGNKSQCARVVRKEHELRVLSLFEVQTGFVDENGFCTPVQLIYRKFHSVYICHAN